MKTKILVTLALNIIMFNESSGLSPATVGHFWYQRRAEGSIGIYAQSKPINNAIAFYEEACKTNLNESNSVALLKCYYFKGSFVKSTLGERKIIFNAGINLGEKMVSKYPNSVPIKFWLGAHWGKWAINFGPIQAAYKGAADKILRCAKDVVRLDSNYNDAGGFNMLRLLHLYAPYVPFVLTWPSSDFAFLNLSKAVSVAPTIGNNYCLAQAYIKSGQIQKAKDLLRKVLITKPRIDRIIEDRNGIAQAKESFKKLKKQ